LIAIQIRNKECGLSVGVIVVVSIGGTNTTVGTASIVILPLNVI